MSAIITEGYGHSASKIITDGYNIGEAIVPPSAGKRTLFIKRESRTLTAPAEDRKLVI
ncbi:MAG: hypothetical protein NXI13_16380 [Proteobacteria bacterium]|nr:hypothetical protein [Pseudomonadota bacterium]